MRSTMILVVVLLVFATSVFAGEKKTKSKAKSSNETSESAKNDRFAVTVIPSGNMPPLIKGLSAAKEAENVKKIDESMTKLVEYITTIKNVEDQFKALYNEMNSSMSSVTEKMSSMKKQDNKEDGLVLLKAIKYNEFAENMVREQDKQFIGFKSKIETYDFTGMKSNGKALNQFLYIETNLKKHSVAMEKAFTEYIATVKEWNSVIKSFGLDS
ncbi:MAG: hypothetical protein HXX17_07045 [Geobacteraceae bacterium]|nr:hypothetical protein [Geobacteraceae bacterium]